MTLIELIEEALLRNGRPLSSKAIAQDLVEENDIPQPTQTLYQTINARVAEEIRSNGQNSTFIRTGPGQYALRKWGLPEVKTKRRKISPLDEIILAIPTKIFLELYNSSSAFNSEIDYQILLEESISIDRREAETTENYVQLISAFIVIQNDNVFIFDRTKKLPESRLHSSSTCNFGGHLQSSDVASLFSKDRRTYENVLFRELFEELNVAGKVSDQRYLGVIHPRSSMFERQHAGLLFKVNIQDNYLVKSTEPGYHSSLRSEPYENVINRYDTFDSWTQIIIDQGIHNA